MPTAPITLPTGQIVALRRSARARRLVLRVSRRDGAAVLTVPVGVSLAVAERFVLDRQDWLARAVASLPAPSRPVHGAALPVWGEAREIAPAPTRVPLVQGGALLVPQGRPPGPVIAAWLREEARRVLDPACRRHAAMLPAGSRPLTALALRDTRSRWGSCTQDGRIMLNWRLAMAPPRVADYVAAHEVAHLARMDHSPAFWAVVARLCPDHAAQRAWLRRHGEALQAWVFRD